MVHVDPKFTQLVNQQRQLEGSDPYDIDLRKDTLESPSVNHFFLSILGCEYGTVASNCGCLTGVVTCAC